jgi:type 1 glutamine amidotransferase
MPTSMGNNRGLKTTRAAAVCRSAWIALVVLISTGTAVAAEPARLLVVSVTTGFRHASIPAAEAALEEIGRETGLFHCAFLRQPDGRPPQPRAPRRGADEADAAWAARQAAFNAEMEVFRKADAVWQEALRGQFAAAFAPAALAEFDGVVFASTTGNLPIPDLDAFLAWIRQGRAFIGFHAATDTLKASDAYVEMVGGHFAGHPWNAGGEHAFVVQEPDHRVAAMFPERFRWKDEIYQYDPRFVPDNLRVLVSLDMAASTPKEPWHVPVSWVRDYGSGRVFYTNFGHNEATWKEPMFRRHATEGIAWALGRFDAAAEPNPDVQAAEYLRSVAAAAGGDADALRARIDERIAADPAWPRTVRERLVPLRALPAEQRAAAAAKLVAELVAAEPVGQ